MSLSQKSREVLFQAFLKKIHLPPPLAVSAKAASALSLDGLLESGKQQKFYRQLFLSLAAEGTATTSQPLPHKTTKAKAHSATVWQEKLKKLAKTLPLSHYLLLQVNDGTGDTTPPTLKILGGSTNSLLKWPELKALELEKTGRQASDKNTAALALLKGLLEDKSEAQKKSLLLNATAPPAKALKEEDAKALRVIEGGRKKEKPSGLLLFCYLPAVAVRSFPASALAHLDLLLRIQLFSSP